MITLFENYMPQQKEEKTFDIGDYIIMNDNCDHMDWYNIYGEVVKYSSNILTIKIMNRMSKSELSNLSLMNFLKE